MPPGVHMNLKMNPKTSSKDLGFWAFWLPDAIVVSAWVPGPKLISKSVCFVCTEVKKNANAKWHHVSLTCELYSGCACIFKGVRRWPAAGVFNISIYIYVYIDKDRRRRIDIQINNTCKDKRCICTVSLPIPLFTLRIISNPTAKTRKRKRWSPAPVAHSLLVLLQSHVRVTANGIGSNSTPCAGSEAHKPPQPWTESDWIQPDCGPSVMLMFMGALFGNNQWSLK